MQRKTIKKLGIIIMSAMIAASPVVAPFTTMTVQASSIDIAEGETVETNEGSVDYNKGTIETNEGSVQHNMGTIETNNNSVGANNSDGGKIETNNGRVANNFGSIVTNENTVVDNTGTITENNGTVTWNEVSFFGTGTITENNGDVKTNDGTITENNGNVEKNNGTIEHNYGNVDSNEGTIENNYKTIDGKGGQVGCGFGSISNQWYEVKLENSETEENPENSEENLENNETEVKIKGVETDSVKDINDSGNVDVFALGAASIIIYSINPSKMIDAVIESLEYVKNDDGSVTINNIKNPLRLIMTSFADRILVKDSVIGPTKPNVEEPENPTPDPKEEDEDDNDEEDEDVIKDDPSEKPVVEEPENPTPDPEEEDDNDEEDEDVIKDDPSEKPVVEEPENPTPGPEEEDEDDNDEDVVKDDPSEKPVVEEPEKPTPKPENVEEPEKPTPKPEKEENDDKGSEDVVKEDPVEDLIEDLIFAVPENLAIPTQIITPVGTIDRNAIVAANLDAAIKVAKTLKNDPVVVALAQELAAQMEEAIAANKELAVKELAETPNQAVVGSAEYEAKQTAISEDLANQVASINKLTVMSLAAVQKTGVSVSTGGCNKLEAANVSLLNDLLTKGVPVTLTYAIDGAPVTLKIPAGVKLTKFIGADGRLDLTKLKRYIVK